MRGVFKKDSLVSKSHVLTGALLQDDGILFGDPLVAPMERLELTDARDVRMSAGTFQLGIVVSRERMVSTFIFQSKTA